ncbi:MAG: glycosyltransferase family 2 protein [Pseudomonadota bacterium]
MNVSVIIPLFNKAPFIERAIRSVFSQTHAAYELIIVDDQSTDDSLEIAQSCAKKCAGSGSATSVQFLQNPVNRGPGASRNVGIEAATGDWLIFLDADDEYGPDLFATAQALNSRTPASLIVLSYTRLPDNYVRPAFDTVPDWLVPDSPNAMLMRQPLQFVFDRRFTLGPGSNATVRRDKLGGIRFDETSYVYEGVDFWFRAIRNVAEQDGACYWLTDPHHFVHTIDDSLIRKPLALDAITPPGAVIRYQNSTDRFERGLYNRIVNMWYPHDLSRLHDTQEKEEFERRYAHLLAANEIGN